MQTSLPASEGAVRFEWVDGVRGMAILWIAFFHCFLAYGGNYPWPITFASYGAFVEQCAPASMLAKISCPFEATIAAIMQRGAQGVGVFILFSGFGLTYSLVRRKGAEPAWGTWYRRRLTRLFPIYWLAHLIFLVSPIQYKPDPIDYRFLLSFLGDRIYPVREMFFYLNPAWWFFGLLIELYAVFPLLFMLMRRLGAAKFLALCVVFASLSRYVLFAVIGADGNWVQGAFFGCRLWEFGAGMVLGKLLAEAPRETMERLFSTAGIASGVALYAGGVLTYQPNFLYSFTDGLSGMGLSIIMIHLAVWAGKVPGLGKAFGMAGIYSYSIYLFHQPFVMYAGDKLRSYHLGLFFLLATAIIAVIALVSMCCEYAVNRALDRLRGN
ncbi:MAG: acyltransferase [Syntrophobacteraceae bacterium]